MTGRLELRSGSSLPWRAQAVTMAGLLAVGALVASNGCSQDPVHDNEVSALGPEDPSVPPGPDHRPSQPCLVCHGGSGPASTQFAVGGTIYISQSGARVPLNGGTVSLSDTNATTASATTNESGNFWVLESQWTPTFPVHVDQVLFDQISTQMFTHIGRDGSCASCHYDPPGGAAVGRVYIVPGEYPDGGFPEGGL